MVRILGSLLLLAAFAMADDSDSQSEDGTYSTEDHVIAIFVILIA